MTEEIKESAIQVAQRFRKQGVVLVKWKHHPDTVRDVIKREHFRPKLKSCFENCGRFCIGALRFNYAKHFTYCEGWVETAGAHLQHAWLLYKGTELVDLTLVDKDDVTYGEHRTMTCKEVRDKIVEAGTYGPFVDLHSFGPYADVWKELEQKRRKGEL
jgi:hypothetical protein